MAEVTPIEQLADVIVKIAQNANSESVKDQLVPVLETLLGAVGGAVKLADVVVGPDRIETAATNPVRLVEAQGEGTTIKAIGGFIRRVSGDTPFASSRTNGIHTAGTAPASNYQLGFNSSIISNTGVETYNAEDDNDSAALGENEDLVWSTTSDSVPGGDVTIHVFVAYVVFNH